MSSSSHSYSKSNNWSEVLQIGNFSGGSDAVMSNGDRIISDTGNSFIDLRSGGSDGITSISNVVYINESLNAATGIPRIRATRNHGQYFIFGLPNFSRLSNYDNNFQGQIYASANRHNFGSTSLAPQAINLGLDMRLLWNGGSAIRPGGNGTWDGMVFNSDTNKFAFQFSGETANYIEIDRNNFKHVSLPSGLSNPNTPSGIYEQEASYWDGTQTNYNVFSEQVVNDNTAGDYHKKIFANGTEVFRIYPDGSFAQKADNSANWFKWITTDLGGGNADLIATQI